MRQSRLYQTKLGDPTRARRAARHDHQSNSDSGESDIGAITFSPHKDSDDEIALLPGPSTSPLKRTTRVLLSDDDASPHPSKKMTRLRKRSPSSDDDAPPPPPTKKRKQTVAADESPPKSRKRLTKGKRPPTPDASDDLLEELDDDVVVESRMRVRDKKSKYKERLEMLKRKKQNIVEDSEEEEASSEDGYAPFVDSRPSNLSDEEAQKGDTEESSDEGEDDKFIVDDGELTVDLPSQFSRNRHRDLSENFKIHCQLLIHVALQKPRKREAHMTERLKDEYFQTARDALHKKMSGLLDQTITSQVWPKEFRAPLSKYPVAAVEVMAYATHGCDACQLPRRVSTLKMNLSGQPYNLIGFEPLPVDLRRDSKDRTEFDLGRFCSRRAEAFHRFSHWEYHLFQNLENEIGLIKPKYKAAKKKSEKLAYDLKDADTVVDYFDKRNVIDLQYQIFKGLLSKAGKLELKGDDDG